MADYCSILDTLDSYTWYRNIFHIRTWRLEHSVVWAASFINSSVTGLFQKFTEDLSVQLTD